MVIRGFVMRFSAPLIAILTALILSACSSTNEIASTDQRDPYETTNRSVFAFNMKVDDIVLEPTARGFRALPDGVQTAVSNHAQWTSYPSTAVNSALQGKGENAALATIHFLINGLTLGFFDLLEDEQDPVREDFGQTLAHWSTPEGPYVVLPLLGSGTARSHTGWVVDALTNPFGFMGEPAAETIRTTQGPVGAVDFRARNYDQINDIKDNAIDPYARTRSIYYQYRQGQLTDGDPDADSASDDAFNSFLNDGE